MKHIWQIVILTLGIASANTPQISINQSFVSPRLHIFDEQTVENYHLTSLNQNFHWQTQLDYNQAFGNFKINSFVEYGSETDFNPNPFRIHNLYAEYTYQNTSEKFGRFSIWNPFMMENMDGAQASLKLNNWGSISVAGGFEPSEIDTTLFSEKLLISSMTIKTKKFKTALYYWYKNEKSYVGASTHYSTFWGINITENFSWNLTDNQKYYYRVNLSKKFDNHSFNINYRVKEIDKAELFPMVENLDNLWVSPTLSTGLVSNIANIFTLQNVLGYRFTESENWFYKTALNWKMLQTSLMYAKQGDSHILGNNLTGRYRFDKNISLGGSIALNTTYYPGDLDQEQSFGSYFWMKYSISQKLSAQIYGRYYQNPYYKMDGRGGISINYVF